MYNHLSICILMISILSFLIIPMSSGHLVENEDHQHHGHKCIHSDIVNELGKPTHSFQHLELLEGLDLIIFFFFF
jgi:hypothetical protein